MTTTEATTTNADLTLEEVMAAAEEMIAIEGEIKDMLDAAQRRLDATPDPFEGQAEGDDDTAEAIAHSFRQMIGGRVRRPSGVGFVTRDQFASLITPDFLAGIAAHCEAAIVTRHRRDALFADAMAALSVQAEHDQRTLQR